MCFAFIWPHVTLVVNAYARNFETAYNYKINNILTDLTIQVNVFYNVGKIYMSNVLWELYIGVDVYKNKTVLDIQWKWDFLFLSFLSTKRTQHKSYNIDVLVAETKTKQIK